MKKYLIVLSLVGLVTTSCYEKLNITPPNNITNEQVMKLLETANSETVVTIMGALADALPQAVKSGGYATFNNYYSAYDYQGQDMVRGSTGNDIVVGNTTPSGDLGNLYEGLSIRSSASNVNQPYWQRGYAMVHAANKVFNMLTDELVEKNGTAVLKEYQGRAFLLRAYAYLYLMENYANPYKPGTEQLGVPVYTKYDVGQPLQARASSAEVYDSIVAWANKAISLFEKSGSVGYARNKSGAMNLGVANFILARAALCKQDWTTVISACDKLIANYSLMSENQYVARTFIQPTQELREQGVRMKLSAVRSVVKGKRVIVIDDSIVRGTTSKRIVQLLKEAGAAEVHMRISSPPLKYPCFYGIDISTTKELIAAKMSVEEIREYIGADSLAYLSLDGLVDSIGLNADAPYGGLCVAYFNGDYPTALDDYEADFLKSLTPEDRVRLPEFALYKSKYIGNEYNTVQPDAE